MTEKEFQELFRNLAATEGFNDAKARLAATWVLAARGFAADAVDCLPHLVFVGRPKAARDRAVQLVARSVEDLLVEETRAPKSRGIILIRDYDERLKKDEEDAEILRELLLRPEEPMRRPLLMGCRQSFFPPSTPALVIRLDLRA
jgi:hypothetical protein